MAHVAGPVSISEARKLAGLRLVVLQGFPSPWSQAAKAILRVKGLPYTLVHRLPSDPPNALEDWTGQASFPAAMHERERPRTGWAEILLLAERLAPEPALVPSGSEERGLLFGLCHEICGELGLGWCRRLEIVHAGWDRGDRMAVWLGKKYGYTPELAAQAPGRIREILQLLADRKARRPFLMGNRLTALDLYFATFLNLVSPLPPELLKLPAAMEKSARSADPEVHRILGGGLLAHRDCIYREHLELPVAL